jgi:hypothetical protein
MTDQPRRRALVFGKTVDFQSRNISVSALCGGIAGSKRSRRITLEGLPNSPTCYLLYALFNISGPLLCTLPTSLLAGVMRMPSDSKGHSRSIGGLDSS